MGVGRIFSKGPVMDFSKVWPEGFFSRENWGESLFYQLKSKRKSLFYGTVNRKISVHNPGDALYTSVPLRRPWSRVLVVCTMQSFVLRFCR